MRTLIQVSRPTGNIQLIASVSNASTDWNEFGNAFDMECLGKKIKHFDSMQRVAAGGEQAQVARHGWRVATHIVDSPRAECGDEFEALRSNPGSGRIENHQVGLRAS